MKHIQKQRSGKFVPQYGDQFWYANANGTIASKNYDGGQIDDYIMKRYPVFRTKKEAEEYTLQHNWKDDERDGTNEIKTTPIIGNFCGTRIIRHVASQYEGWLAIDELQRMGCTNIECDFDEYDSLPKKRRNDPCIECIY